MTKKKVERLDCGCKVGVCSCDPMRVYPPTCCKDCPMTPTPPQAKIKELMENYNGAFQYMTYKTRQSFIADLQVLIREEIRKLFKKAIVKDIKLPNGNTSLVEVTNDFLNSLSTKPKTKEGV